MASQTRATQGHPSSAVAIATPALVGTVLDEYPADQYNQLVPTAYVQQVNPYLRPVVAAVQLDVERDSYHTPDMPNGFNALAKTGLRKLATTAGVSVVDQYRSDDGRDPDVVEYTTKVAMSLPSGQTITGIGIRKLDARLENFASDAHKKRWRVNAAAMAATKSELRALRSLLALQASYPIGELRRPWAVVHFVPDMANPDVAAAMLAGMAGTARRLTGPDRDEPKQLAAPVVDDDGDPELPRDGGTVTTPDGTVIDGSTGRSMFDPSPSDPEPTVPPPLADRLASGAKASALTGPATDEQKGALQSVLAPLGVDDATDVITGVFNIATLRDISAAQAGAILSAAGQPGFADDWRTLAGRLRAVRG